MKFLMTLVMLGLAGSAFADAEWDGWNDPSKMDPNFEYHFQMLPTKGQILDQGKGWPGYHWANNKGGIAQRWQKKENSQDFEYVSPKLNQLISMTPKEKNELSPAEKYDILMGRYDFPTVQSVWKQTREGHREWYGICHGVSPSSLNHAEPRTTTTINKDGIELTFYSSDVKAIMAYYYAKVSDSPSVQIGKRCFIASWLPLVRRVAGCRDVNPASLHVIMANKLGLEGSGFIMDMERYSPVWNHVAVDYNSQVLQTAMPDKKSSEFAVKRVLVESVVNLAASVDPTKSPVIGTEVAEYDEKKYKYWLDLDASGRIVGGSWVSAERPDFIWTKEKDEFKGYFEGLNQIYEAN